MNILRAGRAALAGLVLAGTGGAAPVPAGREAAFAANARLAHTINFGNMLEAPREGEWGLRVEERFFDLARAAGFTAIRLPVRWNAHALAQAPYTLDPAFVARVDWAVAQARKRNLAVIVDFHHYEELMIDPAAHRARFLGIWAQVAAHYRTQPAGVLFEVLNEPNGRLEAVWNDLQWKALAVIRRTNPARVVIVGGGGWNSADALAALKLPPDPNVIGTFHTYTPFSFTHQGADFVSPPLPQGVVWPEPGLRPANGWQSWSWDVTLGGAPGGLNVTPLKAYGALYLHRDVPATGVRELRFVTDRTLALNVVCVERNDGKTTPRAASVTAQAGAVTRVPVSACGGTGTVRDVWLMPQGEGPAPAFTVRQLDAVGATGVQSLLGSAQDEAAAPIRTAAAWGRATGRPVFMGEFGAFRAADPMSRARWAVFLRSEAERLGVSWAWWELASGFGVYDPLGHQWDSGVLSALLPGTPVIAR